VLWEKRVGIYKDIHAFRLMEYIYGHRFLSKFHQNLNKNHYPHENCAPPVLAPSTLIHLAGKLLHLAATNNTDGGHFNTRLFGVRSYQTA
tara:strand:- start:111 stop:380 length:270 start_codon:yes stop_codon:yes gene_type:complete